MAGQLLNLTNSIVTINGGSMGSPVWQQGKDALDVLGYAGTRFDFSLKVFGISGSGATATVDLYTSMYNDDNNDTWTLLGTAFTAVTASNTVEAISVTAGVLRYIKWKVTFADVTVLTFEVLGVAW